VPFDRIRWWLAGRIGDGMIWYKEKSYRARQSGSSDLLTYIVANLTLDMCQHPCTDPHAYLVRWLNRARAPGGGSSGFALAVSQ